MPLLIVFAAGAAGGFVLGKGVDGASRLVQWGLIAGGAYLAAKHLKVL